MRQKYKKSYSAYREYLREGGQGGHAGLIRLMDEFGADAVHAAMKSFHLRYVSDSYGLPFRWRHGGMPF